MRKTREEIQDLQKFDNLLDDVGSTPDLGVDTKLQLALVIALRVIVARLDMIESDLEMIATQLRKL